MKKTAKEMFEQLGYTQIFKCEDNNLGVYYVERNNTSEYEGKRIAFFTDKYILCVKAISLEELQAIMIKCKELFNK